MSDALLLGERLEVWSTARPELCWGSKKDKRGLFSAENHYLHGRTKEELSLRDLISFKGSQGEQTDGSEDYDDIVRYSKDYTIRCLTESKVGGRFLTAAGNHGVFCTTNADVATDRGFNKSVLFKIKSASESTRGITAKSMFAEEVYATAKVVFESSQSPGKFLTVAASGNIITLEGLCARSIFVIKRAHLPQYLTKSGEDFGKSKDGVVYECQKKIATGWVARSSTEHFIDSHGQPLGTIPTHDGLGMWRVQLRDGTDSQGWDYGSAKWSHFLDAKRRPFHYTGKEVTRMRKWVHQNSRFFTDTKVSAGNKGKTRRFSTAAGEDTGRLSFLPSLDDALKQAVTNSVLEEEEDEEEPEESEVPSTNNGAATANSSDDTDGAPGKEVNPESTGASGSSLAPPSKVTAGASARDFDEEAMKKRDDTPHTNWWSMATPIPKSTRWEGEAWFANKISDDTSVADGLAVYKIENTPVGVEETAEVGGDSAAELRPRVAKGQLSVDGESQQATITLCGQEIVIDLANGVVLSTIKDAFAAEKSLAEEEADLWKNRLSLLNAKVEAFRKKRQGKNKLEQQTITLEKINPLLERRLAYTDQARGRMPAQGWLLFQVQDGTQLTEWVFSPIETESSFVYGLQEGAGYIQGKRDNYRNNFEKCRQVFVDNIPDTDEMKAEFSRCMTVARKSLAGMKEYQAKNCAREASMQSRKGTQEELEMEKKLMDMQKEQEALLKDAEAKVFDVINNNRVTPFVQGCQEWVDDIKASEARGKAAAEEGLEILKEQTGVLDSVLESIKIAAEEQALLTLQYAVPLVPGNHKKPPWQGDRQWRIDLEAGKASTFDKIIEKAENKAAEASGLPVGMMGGGPPSSLSIGNPLNADKEDGAAKEEPGDIESGNGVSGASDTDNVKAEDNVANESANLLSTFARQPEEWENHRSFCCAICFFLLVNIILFAIYNLAPSA
jgi:hypothetical protein